MFQMLIAILILLIMIMVGCVSVVNKKVVRNRSSVVHLIWTAVFTTACYTGFILVSSKHYNLAVFMNGLHFLSVDWLVIYLMLFAAAYTRISPPSKLPRRIVGILAGLDSISFLINTYTHHMFDLKVATSDTMGRDYWDVQLSPFY